MWISDELLEFLGIYGPERLVFHQQAQHNFAPTRPLEPRIPLPSGDQPTDPGRPSSPANRDNSHLLRC